MKAIRSGFTVFSISGVKFKLASFLTFFLFCQMLSAQNTVYQRKHLEFYDDKTVHYGFFFGLPNTRFNIKHSSDIASGSDSISHATSPTTQGFQMGFMMNVYLSPRFDFRFSPLTVSIYTRRVDYAFQNGGTQRQSRESTWVEFPFMLKYKSIRRGNTRMYAVGGFKAGFEANLRKGSTRDVDRLNTKAADFSVEYGVGLERFFEFFKFTPELRFSHGIVNMIGNNNTSYTRSIKKLTSHTVTLYLMFE
ncbi:MAG: porin family protein [Siphonobacter sp.]